jgi:hypothetical protein
MKSFFATAPPSFAFLIPRHSCFRMTGYRPADAECPQQATDLTLDSVRKLKNETRTRA